MHSGDVTVAATLRTLPYLFTVTTAVTVATVVTLLKKGFAFFKWLVEQLLWGLGFLWRGQNFS